MYVFAVLFGAFSPVRKIIIIHKLQCATVGTLFSKAVHLTQGMCTRYWLQSEVPLEVNAQQETVIQRMTVNY